MRWGIWAALLLGGCATVIEGTTRTIRVDVVPDTALVRSRATASSWADRCLASGTF
jgi:hypothetical protein